MEALTAPFPLHDSVDANLLQSTSHTCPTRPTIRSSSSPIPPIISATGESKVNELLVPACIPASSSVKGILRSPLAAVNTQDHNQSLVNPLYTSLTLIQKCLASYIASSNSVARRTRKSTSSQPLSLAPNHNNSLIIDSHLSETAEPHFQDLTSSPDNECSIMITTHSAPGSPPDLTDSRSSKSSSYGSQFSAENDLSTEITNFEDIGLEDDHKSDVERGYHNSHTPVTFGGRKDLYHIRQKIVPNTRHSLQIKTSDVQFKTSLPGSLRRGHTSASSVTLASQSSRPRSISPPKQITRSASTYSLNQGGSATSSSPRSSFTPSRRGSWQPTRKTIKEIEAEYHDSDDELPEDANLWNVPITSIPSAGVSPRSSFRESPEREFYPKLHRLIPLEHVQSAPDPPPRKDSLPQPSQRQKLALRSASAHVSRSGPSSPRVPNYLRNHRAKSWNLAMSDLSPEARIVSENLEHHTTNNKDFSKSVPEVSHRSSVPSAIQLPPIQRGTLDFMPISKEKEAVLSRTRPSWLPPKDPKEEQRHLKEYQRMMAASLEAEKKKDTKVRTMQCQKERTYESLNRIWDFYVNPTTDTAVIDRRVYDLCWRGIPSRIRGKVWQRAVGNPLGLTTKTYDRALERAKTIKAKSISDLGQLETTITSWLADIDRDAETAFAELGFFQRNGPLWQDLVDVCEAYVCYRSDTGYLYGLQLIAALVLLQIPNPCEAFIFMANCLNKPIPLAFQTRDITSTQRTFERVVSNLGVKFPKLHDYLFEPMDRGGLGFTGQEVFEPMFRTLFANGLDFDRLCRTWDIWIFEGDRTLIRTAVAILGSLQSQIFDVTGDLDLKRRNVQEMLGWGPFNRCDKGSYWKIESLGTEEAFVEEIEAAGKLDYTGR